MPRLSSPLGNLKSSYDVIVIGSGYGGAVAASRMARIRKEKGERLSVCLLERGLELQPGEYPNTMLKALGQFQIDCGSWRIGRQTSLYDLRLNDDVSVFVGCGLGGTSLVNAGVVIDPTPEVFQSSRWPEQLRNNRSELESGYVRARDMLSPKPYPDDWPKLWKLHALEQTVAQNGSRPSIVQRPNIAVSFSSRLNHVGVQQKPCVLCGDCCSGCNYSAKNTLIMNYLPDAKNNGAEIFTGVDARTLHRQDEEWIVHFDLVDPDIKRFKERGMFVRARYVFLAAGTLGSTEILLRSRRRGLSLSPRLGEGFTGNGDFLAFAYNSSQKVNGIGYGDAPMDEREPVGPTITGMIDERRQTLIPGGKGLLIQEGAIPGPLATIVRFVFPLSALLSGRDTATSIRNVIVESGRQIKSLIGGSHRGALQNTFTYLAMGHEENSGTIKLRANGETVGVEWKGVGYQQYFRTVAKLLLAATKQLHGTYLLNPFWNKSFRRREITVHPLGGCCMADDAAAGVVNHKGQVFCGQKGADRYENLYVCDGSVIPTGLGANPLWTICAVAERTCELFAKDNNWTIDGLATGKAHVSSPPDEVSPQHLGIRFSERMTGYFVKAGRQEKTPFRITLAITSDDLEKMLTSDGHDAAVLGVARAPALSPNHPISVCDGQFRLFVLDRNRVETRRMQYSATLSTVEGERFFLEGEKVIQETPGRFVVWKALSTLVFNVYRDNSCEQLVGSGELRVAIRDLNLIVTSAVITNADGILQRWNAKIRFGIFFARSVYNTFFWPLRPANTVDPYSVRRTSRPLDVYKHRDKSVVTEDGARIVLTRFSPKQDKVGERGPVMLVPGFGMSSYAFTLDTVAKNLTEYLVEQGYDVWVLDYRASDRSPASWTQFSLDDIATKDLPAAVKYVRERTHKDVQIFAHCVGSCSLLLSLLNGLQGVRSAICAQTFTHINQPIINRIQAKLRLADLLKFAGFWPTVSPDFNRYAGPWARFIDHVLRLYPSPERCSNPVCRRLLFLYGAINRHAQLNTATHNVMRDLVNQANLTTFEHLTMMARKGLAVNRHGRNAYVTPENARRLQLPIALFQSEKNAIYLPKGGERSIAWLRKYGGEDDGRRNERYVLLRFPNYGHMDFLIGQEASRDNFPAILEELQRGDKLAARSATTSRAAPTIP
jgi:cholesterol oxidase